MSRERKTPSPIEVVTSVVAAAVFVWILLGQQSGVTTAAQSYVRGGSPSRVDSEAVRLRGILFEAHLRLMTDRVLPGAGVVLG